MPSKLRTYIAALTPIGILILAAPIIPIIIGITIYIAIIISIIAVVFGLIVAEDGGIIPSFISLIVAAALWGLLWILPAEFVPNLPLIPKKQPNLEYSATITKNQSSYFNAAVVAKTEKGTTVGKSTIFELWVCGSKVPQKQCDNSPQTAEMFQSETKRRVAEISIQFRIRAKLSTDSEDLTGSAMTPDIQPIFSQDQRAQWLWGLTPKKAGTYRIVASITPLATSKDEAILPTQNIEMKLVANKSHGAVFRAIGGGAKDSISWIAGLLTTLGITALLIDSWQRKRTTPPESRSSTSSE